MMRILIAFIVLLGAVLLGIQLKQDPGYVLITFNHWSMETTVWFALFSLLLLFMILHILLQFGNKVSKTPQFLRQWYSRHLIQKAQKMTEKGLIEYNEGYWQKAKNHLIQALPNSETPLLNYLTAARAAQKMGDSKLRDHYLREAQQSMPKAKIAVELTQAHLQLANCQWEQALATLRHLHDLAPRHPHVLKLLMDLYEKVRDWPQFIALLPALKKNQVIPKQDFEALQQHVYLQAIMDLIKQNQAIAVTSLFQSLPHSVRNDPKIVAQYAEFLYKNQDKEQAEKLLTRCLRKEFNPQLIELYGSLFTQAKQLDFAQSLLKQNPHSAILLLCLGRMCINQQLWGKAKQYLEQSNEIQPTAATYAELAKLHEELNEPAIAYENYKKGLELVLFRCL